MIKTPLTWSDHLPHPLDLPYPFISPKHSVTHEKFPKKIFPLLPGGGGQHGYSTLITNKITSFMVVMKNKTKNVNWYIEKVFQQWLKHH